MMAFVRPLAAAVIAASMVLAPAAGLAIEIDHPTSAQAKPSNPDLWRSIREGAKGAPGSTEADPLLIKPLPGCTDRALGFMTPVAVHIPAIGTPQGSGPTMPAFVLLAAVFGFFAGGGAILARNLGRQASDA